MSGLEKFHNYKWMFVDGAKITILVGIASMVVACIIGLFAAWAKLSNNKAPQILAGTYTTVIRGVPELILLLLVYYGVPTMIQDFAESMGYELLIDMDPFTAGVLTIGFIYGAFTTEVYRGAFQAIPKGQMEAARAIGMNSILAFRRILLPQMWRFALPGLGNVWMVLIKATALISIIQLEETMRKAKIISGATKLPFTTYMFASLIFLGITIVSMYIQKHIENWANRGIRRAN